MSIDPLTTLASIKAELEHGWKLFDDIFNSFDDRQWAKKFGRTWTYAEQPWHLAYFDAVVARNVGLGPNIAASERTLMKSMGAINEWNKRELAKRSPGHTVRDSLAEMRHQRDALRAELSRMTEADLDRKVWIPLVFGWSTARQALQMVIIHNVAEYWKLWLRTGKKAGAPSASAVRMRLEFMMRMMPSSMNRELARQKPFTMVWTFEGPGGGSWTFDVADGECEVSFADTPKPNLRITMKPENFHKIVAKMSPPPLLMLTGQMRIKGFGAMGTFAKLFPEPRPDQEVVLPAM